MKLKLVKQGDFLGTKCDFYVDDENNVFMSRTQIGYALKYKDPANAIKNIHNKNHSRFDKYSVVLTGAQFEHPLRNNTSAEKVYMYNEFGIYAMCARSRQPAADDFNDWVANVISLIRKNGYYIASEKDSKWIGIREESKQARKYETEPKPIVTPSKPPVRLVVDIPENQEAQKAILEIKKPLVRLKLWSMKAIDT